MIANENRCYAAIPPDSSVVFLANCNVRESATRSLAVAHAGCVLGQPSFARARVEAANAPGHARGHSYID